MPHCPRNQPRDLSTITWDAVCRARKLTFVASSKCLPLVTSKHYFRSKITRKECDTILMFSTVRNLMHKNLNLSGQEIINVFYSLQTAEVITLRDESLASSCWNKELKKHRWLQSKFRIILGLLKLSVIRTLPFCSLFPQTDCCIIFFNKFKECCLFLKTTGWRKNSKIVCRRADWNLLAQMLFSWKKFTAMEYFL